MSASAPTDARVPAPEQRYLEETVRVWLGLPASDSAAVPVLPAGLARLLLRVEEYENERRDFWGCWDYEFSENAADGRLWLPEIDRWVAARRAELAATTALEPLWPDGRRFAVCLTHDVDLVSQQSTLGQVVRFARAGLARGAAGSGAELVRFARPFVRIGRSVRAGIAHAPSTRHTLDASVALETDRGAVASYLFTLPPGRAPSRYDCVYAPGDRCRFRGVTRRIADVMTTLAGEGFDIGLHGSYRSADVAGVLAAERSALERATGLSITSTRQHFLHWDVRWTTRIQEEAGLRVDSSLGFNRNVGFRAGTSLPFRHFDVTTRRKLELLEIPLVIQDSALLGEIGLRLDPAAARRVVGGLVDAVAAVGGALTLSFHPDKLARPDWLSLYEWTLDRCTAEGGWLTSLAGLEAWWGSREARLLAG